MKRAIAPTHRMTVLPNGTLCGAPLEGAKITHDQREVTCAECKRFWRDHPEKIEQIGRRSPAKRRTR